MTMDTRNIVVISNMLKISHEKKCLDVPGPQKCCNIQQNSNHSLRQFNTMVTEWCINYMFIHKNNIKQF